MSVYLSAPWDLIQATIRLPSPQVGNLRNNQLDVAIRNSMNGTLYSYVKSSDRLKFAWDLFLTRQKALELEYFIEYYDEYEWRVTDWEENVYRMYLINDPFDFTRISKDELTTVRLELEGFLIT